MKILFIGLGSIGARHARIIQEHYSHQLFALRSKKGNPNQLGIKELYTWQEVINLKPEIIFITNPTAIHIETAIKCAKLGSHLFIEKPIGTNTEHLNTLLSLISRKKISAYLGYNMRFHPVIQHLKKNLRDQQPLHVRSVCTSYYPNWRKGRKHLKVYSANSKMGGGVILDLSHELDYLNYLFGDIKRITGQFSRRSNVTVDAEDYVDYIIQTSTVPINIHINFFSQMLQRYLQIDFQDRTFIADLVNSQISEYKNEKLVKKIEFENRRDISYENQIKYFFDNISNPKIMNNLKDATKLFRQIIKFKNE